MKRSGLTRKQTGNLGEQAAADYLAGCGMMILQRNWRCRSGELDLIGEEDGSLVFVEVRTRRIGGTFGTPEESVDWRKQKQVRETAQVYLYHTRQFERRVRFDLVAVLSGEDGQPVEINHVRGAF